ncbi:RES family NAD+ phosphorylase (plasmid) [Tistrella mobilis]|uniref:RES domain-containing protein n=1 Tax=Tistrella mobilis TaxID=171437 RepID=A0A161Q040_9PROT|nr:RES family NAD+ phosphorylase [Tistrella mobilis]KYO57687.1 hypothetical protein AUP44_19165 [Tistrella mobilis]
MGTRYCCPECFGDRWLRNDLFPKLTSSCGQCDFCKSSDVLLVEPVQLANWFELLTNVYEVSDNGKLLVEWMKEDWLLFPRMEVAHAKDLLGEVLNNGEVVRKNFAPSPSYVSESLAKWGAFRDEVMHQNRWFLKQSIDLVRLGKHLSQVIADDLPDIWFRARITTEDNILSIDMGAPPRRRASHGRANPAGIPYLYLGSKPETAVAEIRPHTGEIACVAEFKVPDIRAVDLRNPRALVSPFILADASEIGELRADLPFLERLGDELTRPVLPSGAAIDYIPSQYLCEFIKDCGFDGVVYRSSVSDGINLALFDPERATGGIVSVVDVKKVSIEMDPR